MNASRPMRRRSTRDIFSIEFESYEMCGTVYNSRIAAVAEVILQLAPCSQIFMSAGREPLNKPSPALSSPGSFLLGINYMIVPAWALRN